MRLPAPLQARWTQAAPREQRLLLVASALIVVALLWWLGVAPAWRALRAAELQQPRLEQQLQHMLQMQAQAKSLQAQAPLTAPEARRLLEASLKPLGTSAQLSWAGDHATIAFKGIAADALVQWLVQARLNARVVPVQARLLRAANGSWDGSVQINLPGS
jgi:general secretion pathway protein M